MDMYVKGCSPLHNNLKTSAEIKQLQEYKAWMYKNIRTMAPVPYACAGGKNQLGKECNSLPLTPLFPLLPSTLLLTPPSPNSSSAPAPSLISLNPSTSLPFNPPFLPYCQEPASACTDPSSQSADPKSTPTQSFLRAWDCFRRSSPTPQCPALPPRLRDLQSG